MPPRLPVRKIDRILAADYHFSMLNPYQGEQNEEAPLPEHDPHSIKNCSDQELLRQCRCSRFLYQFFAWSLLWSLSRLHTAYQKFQALPDDMTTADMLRFVAINGLYVLFLLAGMVCAGLRPAWGRLAGVVICIAWCLIFLLSLMARKSPQIDTMLLLFLALYGCVLSLAMWGFLRGKHLFGSQRWKHSEMTAECRRRLIS